MFSSLTRKLTAEIERVEAVVATSEGLRTLIFDSACGPAGEAERTEFAKKVVDFLGVNVPSRVDWQIYDHCAAFTRLYAAYEQYVNGLISGYIAQLPTLYKTYDDLPQKLLLHHRTGIAQILIKIGDRGQYRDVEEKTLITAISSGLREGAPYTLVPEAFFVDKQNYKFEVLVNILGSLGLENIGTAITKHPRMVEFMRSVRGDSSTPQGELENFVKYRNEATHGTVENIVSADELQRFGQFIALLGEVIGDLIESAVLRRRVDLGHSIPIGVVQECYRSGEIVVARMNESNISVGDELIVVSKTACRKARILQIQLNDVDQNSMKAEEGAEVGLRLSIVARKRMELHRLVAAQGGEVQLRLGGAGQGSESGDGEASEMEASDQARSDSGDNEESDL